MMKTKLLTGILLASSLLTLPALSFADNDHNRGKGHDKHWTSEHDRGWNGNGWKNEQVNRNRDDHRYDRDRDYRHDQVVVKQKIKVKPSRDWRRGQYLPVEYRNSNYYVSDWRARRLQEPPRGYRWVGVNGDYVLTSSNSNIISQILLGR